MKTIKKIKKLAKTLSKKSNDIDNFWTLIELHKSIEDELRSMSKTYCGVPPVPPRRCNCDESECGCNE